MYKILVVIIIYLACISHVSCQFKQRIVQGVQALPKKYPFIVSIQDKKSTKHRCGGTIINWNYILTAAHCCVESDRKNKLKIINNRNMRIQAGDIDLKTEDWSIYRSYRYPVEVIPHPDYDPTTVENDIALLRLGRGLLKSQHINIIGLSSSTPDDEDKCEVIGWGAMHEKNSSDPMILRKADINIVDIKSCNGSKSYKGKVPENTLCAGEIYSKKSKTDEFVDACQGDSGGPLVCNEVLTGVVSFGYGCGRKSYPGIYTDVSQFRTWIDSIILEEKIKRSVAKSGAVHTFQLNVKLLMVLLVICFSII